ncbi:DUF1064 domain-containing protein [Paraflavitalea pollutisoli]|uniref:DUF1064 domain-containing protein n=1 Tax=Paraflavitalea pollutisoli TaxID=3034143 RepID=UPI0023ED87D0|nr:DUF1064 domain-containing protein [Paraflavitalea sp. H1-2-19X]
MKAHMTIAALQKTACAARNPHLFAGQHKKERSTKRSKYGNQVVEIDGIRFDSAKEGKRYGQLKIMQKAGEIGFLELQVVYELEVNGGKISSYVADFVYVIQATGEKVVEDVKSDATRKNRAYRLKKKLMKQLLNIDIKEV